jgi:hypothetical protein
MINSLLTFFAATPECTKTGAFLGLRPWYYYINDSDHFQGCDVTNFKLLGSGSDVPLVLLAIVDDMLRIAGLVAVVFVIVGAIRFMTSQGNSDEAAQARGTIINALVGLVIALVAIAFVSFIGKRLSS